MDDEDRAKFLQQQQSKEFKEQMESFSNTPDGQSQSSINNDAFAHVFGAERPGRGSGFGFGATPSKVHASIRGNKANKAILDELSSLKEQVKQQRAHMYQQAAEMNQMKDIIARLVSQINQSQGIQQSGPKVPSSSNLHNSKCTLLNWMIEGEVPVGEGHILSTDPTNDCHFVPLGPTCYKVWVTQVFENIHLYRSTGEAHFLGKAIGSPVAWPIQYLKIHE